MTVRELGQNARLFVQKTPASGALGNVPPAAAVELAVNGMEALRVSDTFAPSPRPGPGFQKQVVGPIGDRIASCMVHTTADTAPVIAPHSGGRYNIWLAPEGVRKANYPLERWQAYIKHSVELMANGPCKFSLDIRGDSSITDSVVAAAGFDREGALSYKGNATKILLSAGSPAGWAQVTGTDYSMVEIHPDTGQITLDFNPQTFDEAATFGRDYMERVPLITGGAINFGRWDYGVSARYVGSVIPITALADDTRVAIETPWGWYAGELLFSEVGREFPFDGKAAFSGDSPFNSPVSFASILGTTHIVTKTVPITAPADIMLGLPANYDPSDAESLVWVVSEGADDEAATAKLQTAGAAESEAFPLRAGVHQILKPPAGVTKFIASAAPSAAADLTFIFGAWVR